MPHTVLFLILLAVGVALLLVSKALKAGARIALLLIGLVVALGGIYGLFTSLLP